MSPIWKAADLPAQLTPEYYPDTVYSLKEVRTTPWGLQGRYSCPGQDSKRWQAIPVGYWDASPWPSSCDHEDIWLPTIFPELQEGSGSISGIQVEGIIRGRWIQDCEYRSRSGPPGVPLRGWRAPIRLQGSPPDPLPLPLDYVMQAYPLNHENAVCSADLVQFDVPDSFFKPCLGGRGMLDKLPVELMKEIVGYLVPTGCTYSFFVADRRDIHSETQSFCSVVHQMMPIGRQQKVNELGRDIDWTDDTDSPDSDLSSSEGVERNKLKSIQSIKEPMHNGSSHMALASVNKTFHELIYARFYGGNTFIFHLSSSPFTRIDLEAQDLGTRWFSWSRVLTRNVLPPGPLGPITARAARYMEDIKLSIVAPSEETTDKEAMISLAQMVDSAISLLLPTTEASEAHEDQKQPDISLHLQFSTPTEGYYISTLRAIDNLASGQSDTPRFQPNIVTMQAGFNRVTAKMDIGPGTWSAFAGYELKQPPDENKLVLVLQPLRKLNGLVKDMWTHGCDIPGDFLEEVGLICLDKAERLPTCYTPHYSYTCECTLDGTRTCPKKLPKSGVPMLRWQLEAMGWTFYSGRDHTMEGLKERDTTNSDATSSQTATAGSPRARRSYYVPSQSGLGGWSP